MEPSSQQGIRMDSARLCHITTIQLISSLQHIEVPLELHRNTQFKIRSEQLQITSQH